MWLFVGERRIGRCDLKENTGQQTMMNGEWSFATVHGMDQVFVFRRGKEAGWTLWQSIEIPGLDEGRLMTMEGEELLVSSHSLTHGNDDRVVIKRNGEEWEIEGDSWTRRKLLQGEICDADEDCTTPGFGELNQLLNHEMRAFALIFALVEVCNKPNPFLQGECVQCLERNNSCTAPTPFCLITTCVECLNTTHCPNVTVAPFFPPGVCTISGRCEECDNDMQCMGGVWNRKERVW